MSEVEELQFERAEFDNASTECANCRQPLAGFYFDVNGHTVCEACRYQLEAQMTGGSGAGRALRAIGAGVGAAALGAILYYAIAAITGYEFGLIAIVVGYAVGAAVRWGSNGRGGWHYQTLAMALTYLAIVATYIPPIIQGIRAAQEAQLATPAENSTPASDDATAVTRVAEREPQPQAAEQPEAPPSADAMVMALLLLLAFASAAPFLAGFENIMGLVIIGIGLYEAWKLNRRAVFTITGPHTIARTAST
jgi:hypothetical protein